MNHLFHQTPFCSSTVNPTFSSFTTWMNIKKFNSKNKHFMNILHAYCLEETALGHHRKDSYFLKEIENTPSLSPDIPQRVLKIWFLNYISCLGHDFKIFFHILIITEHSSTLSQQIHHGKWALQNWAYYVHSCTWQTSSHMNRPLIPILRKYENCGDYCTYIWPQYHSLSSFTTQKWL